MSTFFLSKENAAKSKQWRVVDASGVPLGRLATEVATLIRGKHKATYTPHVDGGDFVIIINASKVTLTGNKAAKKTYHRHSGYPGGHKITSFESMIERHPQRVIEEAVYGMLPRGPLGRTMRRRLKVYSGAEHPHGAQQPQAHELRGWQPKE